MSFVPPGPFRILANPRGRGPADYSKRLVLSRAAVAEASAEIRQWQGYAPTPLLALAGAAEAAGLGGILYKDEASRFGLGSFKALGGGYAVLRLAQAEILRRTGRPASTAEILGGAHAGITRDVTVMCATDGNHGKAVAWAARAFGCRCIIYVHERVSAARRAAIAAFGAEVRQFEGNYDRVVARAAADARAEGWHVVSDTSYEGYTEIPRHVMQGYGVIAEEALAQAPAGRRISHVFVQAGVGGLAAGLCAYLWERLGAARPVFVVAEPDRADCLFRSAEAGRPVAVDGPLDTAMAGLACGEVSRLAWEILSDGADAFVTMTDEAAFWAMRQLADGLGGAPPIVAGESAVAGLAAALATAQHPSMRSLLGLGRDSIVLVIGTEGATDPELYRKIVGRDAARVAAGP